MTKTTLLIQSGFFLQRKASQHFFNLAHRNQDAHLKVFTYFHDYIKFKVKNDISKVKEIFKGLSFTDEELTFVSSLFHKKYYKKGTIIFKANDIVDDMFYISDGCLRTYYMSRSGKQHTVQFGIKDWWITDFTAYFSSSKAVMNLEVIEDTTLYSLSKTDKELLYSEIPQVETFIRKKLESAFAAFQKRIIVSLSQSATERYLVFLDTHNNIEKRLKNYHIASYLGITNESLSRIRKELYNS